MSSDTDSKPDTIFGYEKQIYTGRNSIENLVETLKGIFIGPAMWVRGNVA